MRRARRFDLRRGALIAAHRCGLVRATDEHARSDQHTHRQRQPRPAEVRARHCHRCVERLGAERCEQALLERAGLLVRPRVLAQRAEPALENAVFAMLVVGHAHGSLAMSSARRQNALTRSSATR